MMLMTRAQNSVSRVLKTELSGQKTLGFRVSVHETAEVSQVTWNAGKQLESQRAVSLGLLHSATTVVVENSARLMILCI